MQRILCTTISFILLLLLLQLGTVLPEACSPSSRHPAESPEKHARIVLWKTKKVGGSTLCAVLRQYAQHLRVPTFDHSTSNTTKDTAKDTGEKNARPIPELPAPPALHDILDARIMCTHRPDRNWVDRFAREPTTLNLIIFREPISMAVSRYNYALRTKKLLTHPSMEPPPAELAIKWFRFFLGLDTKEANNFTALLDKQYHSNQYVSNVVVKRYPGTLDQVRDLLSDNNHPARVLIFERYNQSLALLQLMLGDMPTRALVTIPAKHHPSSYAPKSEWPQQALLWFLGNRVGRQVLDLYDVALRKFDHEIDEFSPNRTRLTDAENCFHTVTSNIFGEEGYNISSGERRYYPTR